MYLGSDFVHSPSGQGFAGHPHQMLDTDNNLSRKIIIIINQIEKDFAHFFFFFLMNGKD